MRSPKLLYTLLLLFAPIGFSQTVPACNFSFNLNGSNLTSATFPNTSPACDKWTLSVNHIGSGTFSLAFQSAPPGVNSTTPGTWGTYAGTTATGTNPVTSDSVNTFTNGTAATPFLRVVLTVVSGNPTVYGQLQGWNSGNQASGGGGGGIAPCTVDGLGDLACPGSITSGSGGGVAGILDLSQGTTPSIPANSWGWEAPTALTTSWYGQPPNASPIANQLMSFPAPTANVSQWAWITPGGTCPANQAVTSISALIVPTCAPVASSTGGANLFSTTNSTTVTATSPTTLIGTVTGSTTVPVNTFTAGQVMEVMAQGFYSTPATPASLTITLNIGGTIRITTGAVIQIASVTNGVWRLRCSVTTRTTGASGTQIANCIYEGTGATLTPGEAAMQTSSTWTIDTTATQAINLVATWSTATGAPTITSTNVAAWIPGAPVTSVAGLTGAVPGQGTDTKVMTAGTVSGVAATLCTDAQLGATTVGCSGGGGGVSYHFQYYPSGQQSIVLVANNANLGANAPINLPSGGIASSGNFILVNSFSSSGADELILTQLPSTWDGSAILMIVDAMYDTASTGNGSFTSFSACMAPNSLGLSPVWSAAGTTVTKTSPNVARAVDQWSLSVPITGCTAGNFVYLTLRRPSGDSYTGFLDVFGVNVGIKY